ncbi:MAG: transporter substrate-binding domain-containing protein [Pseudomonadota bacterium]
MTIIRCAALLLWLVVAGTAQADTKLKAVADDWPPFSGPDLPNQGISLDVIGTVLRRAGYEVETEILPWARVIDGAKRGSHDIVGSLFFDPAIAAFMTYGDSFFSTDVKFVQRLGTSHDVTSLTALKPYSIAVGEGFLYEEDFDRAEFLNKIVVTTALQALQMVAYERADLTLDSEEVVRYAIQVGDPAIAGKLQIMDHVLASHDIHMAIRSDHPDRDRIVADFNRTLAEMRADGSLAALLAAHVVK